MCWGRTAAGVPRTLGEAAEARHSSLLAPAFQSSQTSFPQPTPRVQMLLCSGGFCSEISPDALVTSAGPTLTFNQRLRICMWFCVLSCLAISLLAPLWPLADFPLPLPGAASSRQHGREAPAALHMDIHARSLTLSPGHLPL